MNKLVASFAVFALFLSSCDNFEESLNALRNGDPTKGTEEMSSFSLGRYSDEDEDEIFAARKEGKSVSFDKFNHLPYFSDEELDELSGSTGISMGRDDANRLNQVEYSRDSVFCRLSYAPFVAKISKVTVVSSDESILKFRPADSSVIDFIMEIGSIGECDVTVTAEGLNTLVRHYHFRVVSKIDVMMYVDAFWLNNVTARLKYKTREMPRGMKTLYMNVRDSSTVIGGARIIDQTKGDKTFVTVTDTLTYPVKQHTDKFRKHKRVILRNVSDAVRHFNFEAEAYGYIRCDKEPNNLLSPGFSVSRDGDDYIITVLGQKIRTDKYQLHWINRTILRYGSWPVVSRYEKIDGQNYLRYVEPYVTKQIRSGIEIIGNNPYIYFNISMKKSQEPSETDDDEDDIEDDFLDGSEEVVDTLGAKLKDYFVVEFISMVSQKQRDSLALVLDDHIKNIPDSLLWELDF